VRRSLFVTFCLCAGLLASTVPARSQALIMLLFGDKIASENFVGGINGGISLTNFTGVPDSKVRLSWSFGAFLEWRLSDHWYLSPDVTFKTPAGATQLTGLFDDLPSIDTSFTNVKQFAALSYITIPVCMKYRFGASGIFAGPQVGYVMAATDNITGTGPEGANVETERLSFYRINRWDVGVVIGYEFLLNKSEGMNSMRLSIKYYQGLLDVYHNDNVTTLNQGFFLNIGIPIGGKKQQEGADAGSSAE